jgi:hypothetical protein
LLLLLLVVVVVLVLVAHRQLQHQATSAAGPLLQRIYWTCCLRCGCQPLLLVVPVLALTRP